MLPYWMTIRYGHDAPLSIRERGGRRGSGDVMHYEKLDSLDTTGRFVLRSLAAPTTAQPHILPLPLSCTLNPARVRPSKIVRACAGPRVWIVKSTSGLFSGAALNVR
jgi:hypothetical protein